MRFAATLAVVLAATTIAPVTGYAQVAGSTLLGVTVTENRQIAEGWSATRQVIGKAVHNDTGDRIGTVDDLIISPDKALSYAIVGVGGFLGLGQRLVAIPVKQFTQQGDKFVLKGATKEVLMKMPDFEYAKK